MGLSIVERTLVVYIDVHRSKNWRTLVSSIGRSLITLPEATLKTMWYDSALDKSFYLRITRTNPFNYGKQLS